jgi:hypothetical protein
MKRTLLQEVIDQDSLVSIMKKLNNFWVKKIVWFFEHIIIEPNQSLELFSCFNNMFLFKKSFINIDEIRFVRLNFI